MANNKFIIADVKETGILVKFEPSITKIEDIQNFMIKELCGVNRWKAFDDNLWFFKQYGYDKFGNPTDEDYDSEDWEDYDSDEDWEDDEEEVKLAKTEEKTVIRRKLRK
jgi:hypothetical protein